MLNINNIQNDDHLFIIIKLFIGYCKYKKISIKIM